MKKNSIVNKRNSFYKSQTWGCDVLGCKTPCGKSLLERGLAVQTWTSNCKPDANAPVTWFLDVRGSREMPKNLNLKVSINDCSFSTPPRSEKSGLSLTSSICRQNDWRRKSLWNNGINMASRDATSTDKWWDSEQCRNEQCSSTLG